MSDVKHLIQAIRTLRGVCSKSNCRECPFSTHYGVGCELYGHPSDWTETFLKKYIKNEVD